MPEADDEPRGRWSTGEGTDGAGNGGTRMSDLRRERRSVLGDFLRARRMRRSPEAAGLPAGPRRRTAGLRREEVALLAQVSPTYYAYLEQGRDVAASAGVLDGIAGALGLTPVERRYVDLLAAGPLDDTPPRPPLDADRRAVVADLLALTDASGLPAYAVDGDGVLVGGNRHLADWYGSLGVGSGNILEWFFTAEARTLFASWEPDARELVARVRFHAGAGWMNAAGRAVLARLVADDPDFARWWAEHEVSEQGPATRRFRRPGGEVTLRLVPVRPAPAPEVSLLVHLPETPPTGG